MKLTIATRKSKLAQVQTELIINVLKDKYGISSEKLLMETLGDKILDKSLADIGGKGLFIKDIERILLEDKADAAVHSMKDVPFEVPDMFEIAAVTLRVDVRDVFVSRDGTHFKDLKNGAVIGTSSNRRAAQLKMLRDDIKVVPIRGNVQTRIRKMGEEKLDGIILAAAGLKRLNMENIITDYFSVEEMIPAVGQGALGVEIKKENKNRDLFRKLDNKNSRMCVEAERSFMRTLNGDCHSTIGAYAEIVNGQMNVLGFYEIDGRRVKKDVSGNIEDYMSLGKTLAEKILEDK
ncbi:hydroxymethylbilane synthase [Clostridium acetobutylicum]|uniref:Porphobilinogen deaminase n=1 Tax=Clostridium acetobutylicum (strain ATCC 824 / DSM 792 / JCM 1419 / IAM 19013 / LMG 5710 / NBRC 13948 / NRRL B-527 / VKM B-1787 / 2291 / W) TaxID=272562 RepID=HEM3_CLOAB|nr:MULTISPECIES: hydroxymethylbilane synthase [Clostridium]Q97MU4.1 RecName: Full=Porphobilinogen deaminase; Short=PBG; AltName: Full=Hydroxymethylbilane synthase; Short=HMBS; AltName: Full=Pre-uroporphyrinogen synthase [Clostridium acetobutylicum ATCC 824]AAK78082.1 Hydroxymrthylbilane syntase (porphobilinogen deaminase) [Clostridium acetobutylicum ATCC 824]ADZ19141.1 porphobilinogen deaminase [Clostridium acetobutylicum EA 2018]AEI33422.1 porphobilinogen deaminase [Clostridium acetobutylicum 